MKKEDIEFLKELQKEMLTQDKVGQANPRFWVVRDKIKVYGINTDYDCADGYDVFHDGEVIAHDTEGIVEYLQSLEEDLIIKHEITSGTETFIVTDENNLDDEDIFYDIDDLIDYFITTLDYEEFEKVYYKYDYEIKENTFFLTNRECKEHIEANHYHYNKPHSYAMTAWRSPQVERLYNILENMNWDELNK